ncbi:MAG: PAS domain S-box protein [Ignavibacteria bacterium]|nr:PAS domain S-box protein [Ignavibacteria bacterium]
MNNILIVDDKSENLYLLELMLKGGGFTTVSARNGAEALVSARQALPDLIISDILMPIMDGFTLCRELKKDRKLKNIPFIFYTATYTDPKDEEFALSLGADRFLLKPLDIPEFISTIKEVLKETKKKNIRIIETPSSPEVVILKEYNEALVRKLEDKMVQIEHAEKEVRKYNIALLREIEERKQYAEALRESEIKYRAFFENSMDSILLTSPDGRIFSANPAACSMFGYSEEELIKFGRSAVVDTSDPRLSLMLEERTLTGKAHGELTFIRKDGTHFPAEISSSLFNDHEGLENTSMIIRDITEQKKAEQKIRESEKRFKAIFDQAPIAIALLDMQGHPIISNSPLSKLVGYSNDELSKMKFTDFTHTDDIDKDMNQFSDLIDGKISRYSMEKRYIHKNGNIVWVNLFVTMLRDENGKPREIIGMAEDITERKRTEEKVREAQILLQASIESPKDIIILSIDKNYKYLYYNSIHENFVRNAYGKDVKLGMNLLECITNDDDRSKAKINYDKALNGFSHTTVAEYGDLERYYYETRYNPIYNDKKEIIGATAFSANITERKRAEETLRESEAKLDEAMKIAKLGTWEYDVDSEQFLFNDQFYSLLHTTAEREGGYTMSPIQYAQKFVHPDDLALVGVETQKALETTDPNYYSQLDHRIICADGEIGYINVNIKIAKDIQGRTVKTYGVNQVITERKRAEEALTYERNLLKALMDNTTDHIYIKDSENRFIRISKAHANIFGLSDPAEAIGKTDFDYFTEEHARLAYDAELEIMKTGKPVVDLEEKETWPDGRVTWVSTTKVPLRDISGKIFGTFGVSRDITERNHILEELMIAKEKAEQSNKMKDAFIANISHEIRTPLNGILGMTSIIQEIYSPNMTTEEEGYFAAIKKSSDRIIRTIDLILNYSQLKTGTFIINPKQVELSSLCEEVTSHFITAAKSKALSLSFQNDLGKTFILADGYSIRQVIFNLLENAIIYTQNGFVKMRLYKSEQDEILLDVIDSGIGIGGEYLDHIFESFRQEKMGYSRPYEGLGLGLAVVKQILSLHNAGISVKSKKGEGTTFTINFREHIKNVEEKISLPNNSDKVETTVEKSDRLVLLVEDDDLNQDIIRKYIIRKYECIVTASYEGVMELLKKHKVDLIVMDISLRESLNGLEITKKLKASKKYNHIPVIAATAHAFEQDRKAAMEAGCDDYLAKPFTKDQLFYKIDKFLQ